MKIKMELLTLMNFTEFWPMVLKTKTQVSILRLKKLKKL